MTWYPSTVTIAAASELLTLAQAKQHCRIDDTTNDDYVAALIDAATAHIEAYCGTPAVSRTVTAKCDGFADFAAFPVVPLASVSSVSYIDAAGATQTLSTAVYETRSDGLTASLALKSGQSWPSIQDGSRITVTAVVGYTALPDDLIHAAKLLVSQWYDQRAGISDKPLSETPHAVAALLCNRRVFFA